MRLLIKPNMTIEKKGALLRRYLALEDRYGKLMRDDGKMMRDCLDRSASFF